MGISKLLFLHQLITKSTFQSLKPHFNSPLIFTQIRKITQFSSIKQMGIPKLLFLHQLISKSTFQSLKPHFNSPLIFTQIRKITQISTSVDNSLHSNTIQFVANSPEKSVIPLIEEYQKGNVVKQIELKKIINTLRNKQFFDRALEVSEWMTSRRSFGRRDPRELAVRLDLTGQVHGVDAAEKFFKKVNDHSERMHRVLLNCYVKANLVDKSLSQFQMMKDKGLITSAQAYNSIISLFMKVGRLDEIPTLLLEMEKKAISPDIIFFKNCLKSLVMKSDTASLEKLVNILENQPRRLMEWWGYCLIGNYFIDGGYKDKAIYYLQKAENEIHDNVVGLNRLITLYAKLGDLSQVMNLWRKHKHLCKPQINVDYMAMISALAKVDAFEEAEKILREWESSGNSYDFHVPNVLLLGYCQKGKVEKAEKLLEDIISKGKTPIWNTWSIISSGHIKCGNMDKALECMKKALELVPEQAWVPDQDTLSSILKWLGDEGEIEEVDQFLEVLSKSFPMNQEMYSTLLRANIRHGNEVGDILERMKASDIDVDEEISKLIE